MPFLRNPDILIGANDLTSLSYLHEPSVLYNLRVRFLQHNSIYTWCGIVLVAVNPFCDLDIYGEETIATYHSNYALSQLDPHIYAVAEDAFTKLEREDVNQSVIVSGESGAGKTVSAKFAMRYFASIAGSDSSIEDRVLASNPIMEAIGNAKTVRNDNSSRFGKYIQILFDRKSQAIMGGNMRTYLLEKSRVTYQSDGERNFHIFYQLCTYARANQLKHLGLDQPDSFAYLGSNEATQYDDMTRFVEALEVLGFNERQKSIIFAVIAAILHGGNIVFRQLDDERCDIDPDTLPALERFCALLGLNVSAAKQWLTSRLLKTGTREIITKALSVEMAQHGREALLKFIYERLFAWIVTIINQALGPPQSLQDYQFIGVLDIYGFEHFETNSFEQFCINYANEVLQQQFNLHVFKLEQEEYVREGIDWQFITFNDNQVVIDLIESRPIGILCLLDEECKMPKGSDETWCAKLYHQIPVGEVFKKPKFGWQGSFIIQHFADVVTYSVSGFLEKNRDTIWEEQIDLLKRSTVIDCLFLDDDEAGGGTQAGDGTPKKGAGGKIKVSAQDQSALTRQQQQKKKSAKATVGFQFRQSLEALMKILNTTEPHYVRCIKPNDQKAAFSFNNERAVQQLRACGVLETIRISSNGFPSRWSYADFANRYRVLRVGWHRHLASSRQQQQQQVTASPQVDASGRPKPTPRKLVRAGSNQTIEIRQVCEEIVKIVYEENLYSQFRFEPEQQQQRSPADEDDEKTPKKPPPYQFGKTKIFFRAGQVALLERIRSQKLRECAVLMQRMVRGWLARRRYQKIQKSVLALQRFGRAYLARRLFVHLKQTKAAVRIQTAWRAYHARQVYQHIHRTVIGLQTAARAFLARRRYQAIRQERAAVVIQRYWRGYSARKHYRDKLKKIVLAQSCIRRHLAKKELKQLRIQARSVEHVTNLNKGLEKKIIELQQRIDELNQDNKVLRGKEEKFNAMRVEMETIEAEMTQMKTNEKTHLANIETMRAEMRKMADANQQLLTKVEALEQSKRTLEEKMVAMAATQQQRAVDTEALEKALKAQEAMLKEQFERERTVLIAEKEKELSSKQQLLSKFMDLENTERGEVRRSGTMVERLRSTSDVDATNLAAAAAVADDSAFDGKASDTSGGDGNADEGFDVNLQQISLMMRCTELEQELGKLKENNQRLRVQISKKVEGEDRGGAVLLADQCAELQHELDRYKKERADLKRVILIEDFISTSDRPVNPKFEEDLNLCYKSLYQRLGDEIERQEKLIEKLRNENVYLKTSGSVGMVTAGGKSLSPYSTLNYSTMSDGHNYSIDPMYGLSNYSGMFKFSKGDMDVIIKFMVFGKCVFVSNVVVHLFSHLFTCFGRHRTTDRRDHVVVHHVHVRALHRLH